MSAFYPALGPAAQLGMSRRLWRAYWRQLEALRAERQEDAAAVALLPHTSPEAARELLAAWRRTVESVRRVVAVTADDTRREWRRFRGWMAGQMGRGIE